MENDIRPLVGFLLIMSSSTDSVRIAAKFLSSSVSNLHMGGKQVGRRQFTHRTKEKNQERCSILDTSYGGRTKSDYPLISTHTHTHPDTLWLVNMDFFQVNWINIFFYPVNKVTDDKKQSNIFSTLQNSNLISKVFSRYCQDLYDNEIINNNDFKIYWLAFKY